MSSSSFFLKYTEHISAQRHWLSDLDVDLGQASEVVHPRENMGRQCEQMKLGEAEGVCRAVGHRCSTVRIAAPPTWPGAVFTVCRLVFGSPLGSTDARRDLTRDHHPRACLSPGNVVWSSGAWLRPPGCHARVCNCAEPRRQGGVHDYALERAFLSF